jgi:threonine synthase
MNVTHLSCSQCEACYEPGFLYNLCQSCGKPLLVHYDLQRIAAMLPRTTFTTRPATLWRYRGKRSSQGVLPSEDEKREKRKKPP